MSATMRAKADRAIVGIVRYPSRRTQMIVQGLATSQAPDSSEGNRSSST